MKTLRLCLGIIMIVLSVILLFASCTGALNNTLFTDNENGLMSNISGGIIAFFTMFIAIVATCTKNYTIGAFITGGLYSAAGALGFFYKYDNQIQGTGIDLLVPIICFTLAIIYILSAVIEILKKKNIL